MVPGIGPSPDKMLLGRLFSYGDAHRYRIGTNYNQLPVNCPYADVHSYSKDGAMRYRHDGAQPPYAPNSYGGPKADAAFSEPPLPIDAADTGRTPTAAHRDDDDFVQARDLAVNVLGPTERLHLIDNIVGHLRNDVTPEVQLRAVAYWRNVDHEIGGRIALGLGIDSLAA
jgi:catalase